MPLGQPKPPEGQPFHASRTHRDGIRLARSISHPSFPSTNAGPEATISGVEDLAKEQLVERIEKIVLGRGRSPDGDWRSGKRPVATAATNEGYHLVKVGVHEVYERNKGRVRMISETAQLMQDEAIVFSAAKLGASLAVTRSTPSDESAASASVPHRGDVWCAVRSVSLRGLKACPIWRGGKGVSPRPASGFGRRFLVHPRARPWPTIGAPRRSRRLRRPRRLGLPLHPRGAAAPVAAFMRRHRWTQVAGDAGSACRGASGVHG